MIINTKIQFEEYCSLMFMLTFRKATTIISALLGLFSITMGILILSDYYGGNNDGLFPLSIGIYIAFIRPIFVYRLFHKNYYSTKLLQESVTYEFTEEKMKITGESFTSESEISSLYKIEELNNWFLIYTNRQIANLIPKKNLTENEVLEIRSIFLNTKGIILKLKP